MRKDARGETGLETLVLIIC